MEGISPAASAEDITRPVPLPRKSKIPPIYSNSVENTTESKPVNTTSLRRLSKSFHEKMRSHSLEKSFRRMIPKRKSVGGKVSSVEKSDSLPDNSFFNNITFNSPLGQKPVELERGSSESSDAESYCTSELPPSYPPPPLPDESTYDELTSVSSEGRYSYYSPGSDSNSIYEELSNYLSLAPAAAATNSESESFNTAPSRYEEIEDVLPTYSEVRLRKDKPQEMQRSTEMKESPLILEEFDPLNESQNPADRLSTNPFADPQILSFLQDEDSGLYGNIAGKHESILSDFENMNVDLPQASGPPPVPPRRFDSMAETSDTCKERRYSRIRSSIELRVKQVARYVADNIDSGPLGRKLEKKGLLDRHLEENAVNEEAEERPVSLEGVYVPLVLYHSGVLLRPGGVQRWGVLAQRKLTLFASKDSPDVKETISLDSVLSLRICANDKISVEGEQVLCFEVSLAGKAHPFVLGALSSSERHVWMRKLLESVTPAFPPKLALDYNKAGWCYLKEGVTSNWSLSSILLSQRTLHLVPSNRAGALITADLRMARRISLQEGEWSCKKASEKGPVLLIDVQEFTSYLQMDTSAETLAWEAAIRSSALNVGPALNQQQITKDFVPVIVEKAVNFVHTHGSVSEGIYRRSGSNSAVSKLLTALRKDAWAVQLSRTEYTEYDVASALKRFFRDLPEPLFIPEIHSQLREVAGQEDINETEKVERYKKVLTQLPQINYQTIRRLIGHMYFIDKLNAKNRMTVENLSAIWGPTLMHVQEGTSLDPNWSRYESIAVSDMITYYPQLFDVAELELQRELKILDVLETFHANSAVIKKPSGDLKVWVYLMSTDGDCVSVAVPPGKVAREMCDEISTKLSSPGHAFCLYEVVCGGALRRPLHHAECVLDTVLRWGNWPESDRRDNCLVLSPSDALHELLPLICNALLPTVDELKFADARTKHFKTYLFELSQTSLCYYKDKSCSVKIHEWPLKEVIWYLGSEAKRNPQGGWSITFFTTDSPPTRARDRPFFGNTLVGTTEQQKRKWMAALLMAQYPSGILPPPVIIE